MAGICALLCLYGMIGYAGLRTARKAKGAYAKLLAGGLTSLILCQALLNVYAVLGLAPLTGVPLPFISSGSTSLVVLLCAMGLLLNIAAAARRTCAPWTAGVSAPRVVIAAGGTAGHVVPAIAVADALRAEGADVRFAGGERAEAELVPAAGYELDPLNIEGISRSNPLKAARAVGKAARRRCSPPGACCAATGPTSWWAAAATRPGRSASRPSCAARRSSSPRPTPTSASPTACSPAARGASASPSRSTGRSGERYLVTGRPVPPTVTRPRRRARAVRARGRRDRGARVRRLARGALDQRGRGRARSPTRRTGSCTSPAGATSPTLDRARPALRPARLRGAVRPRAGGGRPGGGARRRLGVRARPVRAAVAADPVSARVRQPPGGQRALDGARGRRRPCCPTPSSRPSGCAPRSTRWWTIAAPRGDGGRLGTARATGRRARDRARGAGRRRRLTPAGMSAPGSHGPA